VIFCPNLIPGKREFITFEILLDKGGLSLPRLGLNEKEPLTFAPQTELFFNQVEAIQTPIRVKPGWVEFLALNLESFDFQLIRPVQRLLTSQDVQIGH
jgi:hypothetical protein